MDGEGGDRAPIRIGELARRTGVATATLRSWERRYGLLSPERTGGGYRLYGPADERAVQRMVELLGRGVATAEAAGVALAARNEPAVGSPDLGPDGDGRSWGALVADLSAALDAFDDGAAHDTLDRLLAQYPVSSVLSGVVLPYLRRVGERWANGELTVAQEHFASGVLRQRLTQLGRGIGSAAGPRVLLACVPGELHDLGLLCFALAIHEQGYAVTFLGSDTPVGSIADTADRLAVAGVVLTALDRGHLVRSLQPLTELAALVPTWLAGAGADEGIAVRLGAGLLTGDPVSAAADFQRELTRRAPR